MPSSAEIVWQLLYSALTGLPVADRLLDDCSDEDWQQVFDLARTNRVTALCSQMVSGLPTDRRPSRILWLRWLGLHGLVEQQGRHKNQVAHELCDHMRQHGIETVVLKGPRLAACYPNPALREYDDLDLYHLGRHREADQVVREILQTEVNTSDPHHSTYCYRGVNVENHYTFIHNRHAPSMLRTEQILHDWAPSADFDALYLLCHAASHFAASRITLRHACDWSAFVRRHHDAVDWGRIQQQLKQTGMMPFAATLHRIAVERLGAPVIDEMEGPAANDSLTARIVNDLTYGEFGQPSHPRSGIFRAAWKWRRYQANRWKRQIVYRDSEAVMLLRGVADNLRHPGRITRKH